MAITKFTYQGLDENGEAWPVALDVSNAFDWVWHTSRLHKLNVCGVRGRIFALIQSFLKHRVMKVALNGYASISFHTNAASPGALFSDLRCF